MVNYYSICQVCGEEKPVSQSPTCRKCCFTDAGKAYLKQYKKTLNTVCERCGRIWKHPSESKLCRACIAKEKQSGKSFEERYGRERAEQILKKMSIAFSGENNPNYKGKYQKWTASHNKQKGKSLEEWLGKEKADALRKKRSENAKGKNNSMYGKPAPKKSGCGIQGYYNNFYFRSLLELQYILMMEKKNKQIETAETKEFQINYIYEGRNRTYHPDFYIKDEQKIIELKPKSKRNHPEVLIKEKAAKELYGEKYEILTEDNIQPTKNKEILKLYNEGKIKPSNKEKFEHALNKNYKRR